MSLRTFIEGQGWLITERLEGWVTPEGGRGRRLTNKTGAPTQRGAVVELSSVAGNSFKLTTPLSLSPFGIVYDAEIPDGQECFVVTTGFAQVLLKDGTATTAGNWSICSDVPGRVDATASAPNPNDHWQEIGHSSETKSAGTNVLALHTIHFN